MVIASAQGPLHLTIPIVGGRDQKTAIKDICIAYDAPWRAQHLKAIQSSYKRSPYFEYYEHGLEYIYATKPEKLVDFLIQCHSWLKQQIKGTWSVSQQIEIANPTKNKLFDPWLPKNYHLIENPIVYQQVYQDKTGFLPNLSILDILFCCGGNTTLQLLKGSQRI